MLTAKENRKLKRQLLLAGGLAVLGVLGCNTEDNGINGDASGGVDDSPPDDSPPDDSPPDDDGADSTGEVGDGDGDGGSDGGSVPCGYVGMLEEDFYHIETLPTDESEYNFKSFIPEEQGDCYYDGIFDAQEESSESAVLRPGDNFDVYVYHPQDAEDDSEPDGWPDSVDNRPAVFFGPGNGYDIVSPTLPFNHRYQDLIEGLVQDGFVVFAIQPTGEESLPVGGLRAALACTMIWARDYWEYREHLAEFMVLAGHSRTGGAAYMLTEDLLDGANGTRLPVGTSIDEWSQCALMTYAQLFGESVDNASVDPISHRDAPPFLSMVGTIDEDMRTRGILAYDNRFSESANEADDTDEAVLVIHGQSHASWGGGGLSERPFAPFFSRNFLRWQMMGEDSSRRRFMDLIDVGVEPCAFEDLNPGIGDPDHWSGPLEAYYSGCSEGPPYPDVCCEPQPTPPATCDDPDLSLVGATRPLVFADFGQGTTSGAMPNGANRVPVDTLDRDEDDCAIWANGEIQDGHLDVPLSNSTFGGAVTVRVGEDLGMEGNELDGPCVCISTPSSLNDYDSLASLNPPSACDPDPNGSFGHPSFDAHDGNAMLVRFGGDFGPVSIRWSLIQEGNDVGPGFDLSGFTHFSIRLGNMVTDAAGNCSDSPLLVPDEFVVNAYLEDDDLEGAGPHMVPLGIQVESDERNVLFSGGNVCRSAQFMHTLRIPLALFCADDSPVSIEHAQAFILEFPDDIQDHLALVDSIELVRDPDNAARWPDYAGCGSPPTIPPPCPTAHASAWNCVADELVATETSCSGEPLSGECDVIDIEENLVSLPEVEIPNDTFEGWVVHIPKGWLQDPENPTEDELDDIRERCVAACELEYADDPFVTADCGDPEAFLEPTLRNTDDIGALVSIPDAHAHGDDLFTGESVDCDLRSDCSTAFDENLGPSRPRRPTPQAVPLHREEEWLLTVTGDMQAGSSYAADPPMMLLSSSVDATAEIGGTVGYSRCAPGYAPETCPFYLASMELELLEPLSLDLECDSELVSHELTELTIRLVQPAFGVSQDGTTYNGFPPGGLVFEAEGVVDEIPFTSRRPIEQPVYVDAADGLLMVQGALDGLALEFDIPCNGLMADVGVGWSLVEDEVLEGPPTLGIAHLPATMSCPDDLPLTLQWSDDPEEDYESLQWIVDGVLLDGEFPTLAMTESHEITAVLRDSRGATGSATTTVICE